MLRHYISVALRWAWLVLLASLLAGSITYTIGKRLPPTYEASARLIIGPGIKAVNPNLNDMRAAAQLIWTYAEFVTSQAVLQEVINAVNLPMDVEDLQSLITVNPDQTTLWLTIQVRSQDDEQAVVIANALANSLLSMSPSSAGGTGSQVKTSIFDQIQAVEQEVLAADAKLTQIETALSTASDLAVQTYYENQLAQERLYSTNLRNVLASLYNEYQVTYTNQVTLVESPTEAQEVDSNLLLTVVLASLAGLISALALVLAFEYFANAINTPEELADATGVPLLGVITKHKPLSGKQRPHSVSDREREGYVLDPLRPTPKR